MAVKSEYPKVDIGVEIVELREIDDDWMGDILGFFCEGHYDAQSFAIAVNCEHDLAAIEKPIHVSMVVHGYAWKEFIGEGETWEFLFSRKHKAGYFPCTYASYD